MADRLVGDGHRVPRLVNRLETLRPPETESGFPGWFLHRTRIVREQAQVSTRTDKASPVRPRVLRNSPIPSIFRAGSPQNGSGNPNTRYSLIKSMAWRWHFGSTYVDFS